MKVGRQCAIQQADHNGHDDTITEARSISCLQNS